MPMLTSTDGSTFPFVNSGKDGDCGGFDASFGGRVPLMRSGDNGKSTIAGVAGALNGGGSMILQLLLQGMGGYVMAFRDASARLSFGEPVREVQNTNTGSHSNDLRKRKCYSTNELCQGFTTTFSSGVVDGADVGLAQ